SLPNGKVYAIGGQNFNAALDVLEEFNPGTNSWATKSPMPTARRELGAGALADGELYAIGGFDGNSYLSNVQAYRPVSDTWSEVPGMLTARSRLAVAASGWTAYALGGVNEFR